MYLELIDVGLLGLGSWTAQLGYSALLPGWAGGWAGEIEIDSIDCQHIGGRAVPRTDECLNECLNVGYRSRQNTRVRQLLTGEFDGTGFAIPQTRARFTTACSI